MRRRVLLIMSNLNVIAEMNRIEELIVVLQNKLHANEPDYMEIIKQSSQYIERNLRLLLIWIVANISLKQQNLNFITVCLEKFVKIEESKYLEHFDVGFARMISRLSLVNDWMFSYNDYLLAQRLSSSSNVKQSESEEAFKVRFEDFKNASKIQVNDQIPEVLPKTLKIFTQIQRIVAPSVLKSVVDVSGREDVDVRGREREDVDVRGRERGDVNGREREDVNGREREDVDVSGREREDVNGREREDVRGREREDVDVREREDAEEPVMYSIKRRAQAYQMLRELADFLINNEPHAFTGYILKGLAGLENKSLNKVLRDYPQLYELAKMDRENDGVV